VEDTLDKRLVDEQPERLIGDRAYDSDPLDENLAARGISLIAPHKSNRKKPKTQDGRALRRYRRRWKVERLFACCKTIVVFWFATIVFLRTTSLSFT
jgi:hypothetical protein